MISFFLLAISIAIVCNVFISILPGLPKGDQRIDRSILRSCLDSLHQYHRMSYTILAYYCLLFASSSLTIELGKDEVMKGDDGRARGVGQVHFCERGSHREMSDLESSEFFFVLIGQNINETMSATRICSWYPVASCNAGA